jgi:hypothetical protein
MRPNERQAIALALEPSLTVPLVLVRSTAQRLATTDAPQVNGLRFVGPSSVQRIDTRNGARIEQVAVNVAKLRPSDWRDRAARDRFGPASVAVKHDHDSSPSASRCPVP